VTALPGDIILDTCALCKFAVRLDEPHMFDPWSPDGAGVWFHWDDAGCKRAQERCLAPAPNTKGNGHAPA